MPKVSCSLVGLSDRPALAADDVDKVMTETKRGSAAFPFPHL
jgi:hypothetical protein